MNCLIPVALQAAVANLTATLAVCSSHCTTCYSNSYLYIDDTACVVLQEKAPIYVVLDAVVRR